MSVRWVRVGDIIDRRVEPVDVDPAESYQMIGLLNRGRGVFSRGTIKGSDTKYPRLYALQEKDLVFSRLFAWEGSVAISDRAGWVSAEFPVYDVSPVVDHAFLNHAISWPIFIEQLAGSTVGMGQRRQRVPASAFEKATIPLPDLDEQHRVAARLDAVARTAAYLSGTDALAAARRAVWEGAAKSPEAPLGSMIHQASRPRRVDQDATYRMLGIRWYGAGPFVRETVTGSDLRAKTVYDVEESDLIYNRLFAWKGSFGLVGPDLTGATVSNEFPTFTAHEDRISAAYVHAWLQRPEVWSVVEQQSTGSTPTSRNRFSIDSFLRLPIPLPDLDEQRRIVDRLDAIDRLQDAMRRRDALAAALLPAARNEEFSRLVAQAG